MIRFVPHAAAKFVDYMGGASAVIARAKADFAKGEFRWVAQVMKEVVYAEPSNIEARALCADALEQMGYQAESATWRNAFLYAALELRHGVFQIPARSSYSADMLAGLSTDSFFDMLAIRLDPAKATDQSMRINWHFTDRDEKLGIWFLSSRPEAEHHELVLAAGRDVPAAGKLIQQISFRCDTLTDVIGFYRRLRDAATRFDMIVSHGNAVGVYFFDPEGNRCEIYWQTGLKARQPFVERIDIEMDPELLIDRIRASADRYAQSGLAEPWYVADTLQASRTNKASLRDSGRET